MDFLRRAHHGLLALGNLQDFSTNTWGPVNTEKSPTKAQTCPNCGTKQTVRGTLAYKGGPRREGRRSPCSTSAGTCWSRNSDFF